MQEKDVKKIINSNSFISNSISDTEEFAKKIAKLANVNDVFCLEGDLGTGKTVIAKAIGKFFNVDEELTSPTFTILKTYNTKDKKIKKIHHFDLYRIKNINELANIGFEDYLYDDNSIVIIEWPEVAVGFLPENVKRIIIKKIIENGEYKENSREIIYEEDK